MGQSAPLPTQSMPCGRCQISAIPRCAPTLLQQVLAATTHAASPTPRTSSDALPRPGRASGCLRPIRCLQGAWRWRRTRRPQCLLQRHRSTARCTARARHSARAWRLASPSRGACRRAPRKPASRRVSCLASKACPGRARPAVPAVRPRSSSPRAARRAALPGRSRATGPSLMTEAGRGPGRRGTFSTRPGCAASTWRAAAGRAPPAGSRTAPRSSGGSQT
mmetsp:Transcript_22188/g.60663  ORF Transcript_22188/g.60663 Transcript_22188/m.60663 type:complete len:221 (+) Transcript_22188:162-824(+)